MPILATKLTIPPLRPRLVTRTGLFHKLNQGIDCGFVLISAPAGYGKTTLLNAWLRQLECPATWITLDSGDNDPARFLSYLSKALAKVSTASPEETPVFLPTSPLPPIEVMLIPLINHFNQSEHPFWLVLDDYHQIQNGEVHQIVAFLLENRPATLHLAIATRADPPLPLSRMRARGEMVELRLADLRFTPAETAEFLRQGMKLPLSDEDLARLESSTEGWIAGLQMAALSLQGKEDPSSFIQSFSGENRYILDFLFEEVFQQQAEELQNFLLQTSVLDKLCGPLCDTVIQGTNSQFVLETLERSNLFLLSLDEQRRWYRYHHLFSDLLKARLKRTAPERIAPLHQRASAWHRHERNYEQAIAHALAAQDFESAASLVEQVVQDLDPQNQQALLTSWVDQMPGEIMKKHPWLCVYRAWGAYWTGRREMGEDWLVAAENCVEGRQVDEPERSRLLGYIHTVRAHTALAMNQIEKALEMAQKALEFLPPGDQMRYEASVALGGIYWALGNAAQSELAFGRAWVEAPNVRHKSMAVPSICYVGIQQVKQGHLQEALASFQTGLNMATLPEGTETPMAGFPNIKIGDVWRERNHLVEASQYLWRGLGQCLQINQPDVLTDAYICLARFQLATGDLAGVHETIAKASRVILRARVDPFLVTWLEECQIKTWLANGDLEAAQRWAQKSDLLVDGPLNYLQDLPHQNLARVLVAQAVLEDSRLAQGKAEALLDRLLIASERAGWVHETIKIRIQQSLNHQAAGRGERAVQSLARAIRLAEPGGYIRVFVDEGERLRSLLITLIGTVRAGQKSPLGSTEALSPEKELALKQYLHQIISNFGTSAQGVRDSPGKPKTGLVEALSEREKEVLELLARGYSDKRIAETLVIARETVHKHLKNIYGKLDVHSRTEAIARAQGLGILE